MTDMSVSNNEAYMQTVAKTTLVPDHFEVEPIQTTNEWDKVLEYCVKKRQGKT